MAKLQKQLSRKVGNKKYPKYVVVIPEKDVKKAGFSEGEELKINSRKGRIVLKS